MGFVLALQLLFYLQALGLFGALKGRRSQGDFVEGVPV